MITYNQNTPLRLKADAPKVFTVYGKRGRKEKRKSLHNNTTTSKRPMQ
jgi:hypothetical protein